MNIINVDINFKDGINKLTGINLITGDYASTKMVFNFDRTDGTKVLEMKNPSGQLVYDGEILNNEVLLCAVEEGHNYSIFNQEGRYIYEISLYKGDSKLTSVKGELPVQKEQVIIDGEIVEPYLPIFDELMQDIETKIEEADLKIETINQKIEEVNTAIEETNNLDIDVSDKVNKDVTITLTKKDNTTKSVVISDGTSLQFVWQGTSLGIKTDDMQDYVFVDLQGRQGVPGPQGEPFRIKKTYPSVEAMNADFNNMNYGDYVMIASSVEVQDNAKLYTRGETQWIFITDFSGATGIKGETGATPNIQIGTVTSGSTPSVTRTGTDENPILNFVLQKGDKGDTGNTGATGATGNGISNIEKTSETATEKDYRINFTDGTHFDYSVENGEVTQEQLDETNAMNELLLDQIPKGTATGQDITLNDSSNLPIKSIEISGNTSQDTLTGKNLFNGETYASCNSGQGFIRKMNDQATIVSSDNNNLTFKNDYTYGGIESNYIPVTANTTYTISLNSTNLSNRFFITQYDSSKNRISTLNNPSVFTFPLTFTATNDGYVTLAFTDTSAMSNNCILTNIQLESGSTATTYEPYTGGIASPNPDYPQEVKVVKGDNTLKVEGKNLLNINLADGTYNELTFTKLSKDTYKLSGTTRQYARSLILTTDNPIVEAGQNYTFSCEKISGTFGGSFVISIRKADNSIKYNYFSLSNTYPYQTQNIIENKGLYQITFYIAANTTTDFVFKLQFEKGNQHTAVIPYTEKTYDFNLPVQNYFEATYIKDTQTTDINAHLKKGTYTLSLEGKPNFGAVIYIQLYKNNTIINETGHITNTSSAVSFSTNSYWYFFQNVPNANYLTFELDDDYDVKIALYGATGTQKAMLEKGTKANSYWEYGTTPIEMCKIGNYKDIFAKPSGKNLFDVATWVTKGNNSNYYSYSNGKLSINAIDSRSLTDFVDSEKIYLENGTYYLSNIGNATIRVYDQNSSTPVSTNQFEVTLGYIYLKLVSSSVMTCEPMLNKGTTALPYEPYDTTKWYKKGLVGKVVLDGTQTYNENLSDPSIGRYDFLIDNAKLQGLCLSTHFKYKYAIENNCIFISGTATNDVCFINNSITTKADILNWLSTNNVDVYYQLATPEYTLCNDTLQSQLDNIWNMKTNKNVTNISITADDLKPYLDIVYRKDLETLLGG